MTNNKRIRKDTILTDNLILIKISSYIIREIINEVIIAYEIISCSLEIAIYQL